MSSGGRGRGQGVGDEASVARGGYWALRPPPHPVLDQLSDTMENLMEDPSSLAATIGVGLIQTVVFMYDFLTYPLYYAVQAPWQRVRAGQRVRAHIAHRSEAEIHVRPVEKTCPSLEVFQRAGIRTMLECFEFAVASHSHKRMVGTRKLIRETDEEQPNGKMFKKWEMGDYEWKSYVEVDQISSQFGKGLREMGLRPRDNIAIFAETKAEWLMCAMGCFKHNFPLVTLYANLGEEAISHGLNQTEVTHVITTHDLLPKFKHVLAQTPTVQCVIFMEDQLHPTDRSGYKSGVEIVSFTEVCQKGRHSTAQGSRPTQDDPAIIMYTSGSTGVPKGVILPHEALITTIKAFHFVVEPPRDNDIYLGYLPLAHILEITSEMTMFVQGIPVGYSSPNTMIDASTKIKKGDRGDCSVLSPSLMCAVPLVIDRIYKGIHAKINAKGVFFKKLMDFFFRYKSYYHQKGLRTPILDAVVFKKFRALVGGRIRLMLSGGAPLAPDTHDMVRNAFSLPLVGGYGLTETCACATIMDSDELSTGRVGPPLQGVELKLINWEEGNYTVKDTPRPRGEIVIGGGNVATGYYKMEEKTKEEFYKDENGRRWFKTGDIGEYWDDGTLKIVDRKKDLVKLQYGEYVSLGKVESILKTCPLVENICIYGESSETFCVAILVPDRNKVTTLAESLDLDVSGEFENLCQDKKLVNEILKQICTHGKKAGLERFELPGALTLTSELWTPESGLVTAAFKLRRKPIKDYYQKELKEMYSHQ
ncbi:hypothetical protein TCAL_00221 [Tigriopus californicus]|uniref:long-chain-fatty-acid--CoA ligase n=1 Tax=Tigriopus californicus TaxID=6832 RepID=A0A553P1F7_TIGCA|nr:long-chain-fatty-acid--CoA ligase 4-like [Tigriopus californicus]TRY71515.1 hypothetical protein TCAL_00221 [Tigriopus californicus]|eukprot:TCALIF_00221-PA protein Name:"Similar to Acsl4 Long-chain-fatty-acid--CoA ligase 4 (Rattus norvegicus)" AED:0.01 eAED:0.01 QI:526/1/1/1/1/1/2/784/758